MMKLSLFHTLISFFPCMIISQVIIPIAKPNLTQKLQMKWENGMYF